MSSGRRVKNLHCGNWRFFAGKKSKTTRRSAIALIYRNFGGGDEPMGVGVAVGVFVGILFAATNAAYVQGKKDAAAEIQSTE